MAVSTIAGLTLLLAFGCVHGGYMIGVGRYDITGPAVQTEMMGMANPSQIAHGIHFRQYSRAFIMADKANAQSRVVFVSIDACMGTQILKSKVIQQLANSYGGLYTDDNVCISGTHTHSGPAGYFQYMLYEVMSLGFVNETLDALVEGIVQSIKIAHDNMVSGKLFHNAGQLLNASRNRSPTAYVLNLPTGYEYDTDKGMTVIKFVSDNKDDLGMINWFPVHGTSMNNSNDLISGDNKGYASLLHEKSMDPDSLPGQSKFVAAYAQSNEGDVTPNLQPEHCPGHPDIPCRPKTSDCKVGDKTEFCIAFGPGKDMFESTQIIGERQFDMGKSLYDSAWKELDGPVQFIKANRDFSNIELTFNGKTVHTCVPAMGDSFAAGTIDGPGAFSFRQNDTTGNKFWDFVGHLLHKPSKEQIECHYPKPILLDTGDMDCPYPWAPKIIPLQLLRVGQLVIIAVPAEFTTAAGRILKNAVQQTLNESGMADVIPVIAGLSNTYSDYVTTYYEYQQQRYEGASTIFGPYTHDAYVQEFKEMAVALAKNNTSFDKGPATPDYEEKQISFRLPILKDSVPKGKKFGDVKTDARQTYNVDDVVEVVFWAGNPRNDRMTNKTYLTVELQVDNNNWKVICTDSSFDTRFRWAYDHSDVTCVLDDVLGGCSSHMTIQWFIPSDTPPGDYRIQHFGAYRSSGKVTSYQGTSGVFRVGG